MLVFILIFKWQPWVSRLHVPLILLAAPVAGMVLDRARWLLWAAALALAVVGSQALLYSQARPLTGPNHILRYERPQYYFVNRPDLAAPYAQAAGVIRSSGCRDVGLVQDADSWEYPLWALTGFGQVNFQAFDRAGTQPSSDLPCLVLTLDTDRPRVWSSGGTIWAQVWAAAPFKAYVHPPLRWDLVR